MSKKTYAANGGVMRSLRKFYAADGGENRKLRKLYAADGGVLRLIFISAYRWAVFNSIGTTSWDKSEAVATTTYIWKRYQKKTVYGEWRLKFIESTSHEVDLASTVASYKYFRKISINKLKYSEIAGTVTVDKESFAYNGGALSGLNNANDNIIGVDEDGNDIRGLVLGAFGDGINDAEGKFDYSVPEGWTHIAVTSSITYNSATGKYTVYEDHYEKTALRTADIEPDMDRQYTEVASDSRGSYPTNGESGEYWYVYDRQESGYKAGETIGTVSSTSANAYPSNGRHTDGYWYRRTGIYYTQGEKFMGTAENENENAYPSNGRHTDGLWYVRED